MKTEFEELKAWADIVIERWQKRMKKLKIGNSNALLRSFMSSIEVDANGNAQKIAFTYLYYGIFPDMGVGKGVPLDKIATSNRTPKPWKNAVVSREVSKLQEILVARYGTKVFESLRFTSHRLEIKL